MNTPAKQQSQHPSVPTTTQGVVISRLCADAMKQLTHKLVEHDLEDCTDARLLIGSLAIEATDNVHDAAEVLAASLCALAEAMGYECHICMVAHRKQRQASSIKAKA